MLLQNLIPNLPLNFSELWIYLVAILGAIMVTYAIFLEIERRQDLVFLVGAYCLFIYALYINNAIFAIAMFGLFAASTVEFIEIYVGLHKHSPEDLKRYKNMR